MTGLRVTVTGDRCTFTVHDLLGTSGCPSILALPVRGTLPVYWGDKAAVPHPVAALHDAVVRELLEHFER